MIYTIGDSFTAGAELEDTQSAWPYLLGIDVVNDARQGVGNEFIVRKTIQAIDELKPSLIIVAWTSCGRVEFADEHGIYDIWPGCNSKKFENNQYQNRKELIKYITTHNHEEHEYRRWLRQVILLQSFLRDHKTPYLMCSAFDNQIRNKKYQKHNEHYWKMIDTKQFIGWPYEGLVEWAYGTPHGPGGHPLELGHQRIADKIAEYISN